jgi:CRISPR-associated protein Cmr3
MQSQIFEINALSPLLFRDGRPFSASSSETHARSMPLPLPNTIAGFMRTQVGNNTADWNWYSEQNLDNLHALPIHGPLLVRRRSQQSEYVFTAPRDALVFSPKDSDTVQVSMLKPVDDLAGMGCDLPDGLRPLAITEDVKPVGGYAYWSASTMEAWLRGEVPTTLEKIAGPALEKRTHVAIDPKTGGSVEGMLFGVQYHDFSGTDYQWSLRLRAKLSGQPANTGHLGGERGLVGLSEMGLKDWCCYTPELLATMKGKQRIKMVLATPAIFDYGWKPSWLERSGQAQNQPKGVSKVQLKLVGAAIGRREPVSGWNMRLQKPKATRYMVPAGSVYFFECMSGDTTQVLESWLKPVSDNEQDRKDGFGLALWGVW